MTTECNDQTSVNWGSLPIPTLRSDGLQMMFFSTEGKYSPDDYRLRGSTPWATEGVFLADLTVGSQPPADTTPPTTPGSVNATAVSSTQIKLGWNASTDNVGVTGYKVYRNGNLVATVLTTSYSDSGLASSTSYAYTVSAFDAAGNVSNLSISVSATTPLSGDVLYSTFETGTAPWVFYTNGGGTFTTDAAGPDSAHAGHIKITAAGTNVQLYQAGLVLEPNTLYTLSFNAYSNTGHDLSVSLQQNVSPYTNYGLVSSVANLTNSWKTYTIQFTTTGFSSTVNDGRLMFWLAQYAAAGDEYYIDDVELTANYSPVIGILGTGAWYFALTGADGAYEAAASGAVIQIQNVDLPGNFNFNLPKAVVLEGGYDPAFASNAGSSTTLLGSVTITSGTVTVENIVIQ